MLVVVPYNPWCVSQASHFLASYRSTDTDSAAHVLAAHSLHIYGQTSIMSDLHAIIISPRKASRQIAVSLETTSYGHWLNLSHVPGIKGGLLNEEVDHSVSLSAEAQRSSAMSYQAATNSFTKPRNTGSYLLDAPINRLVVWRRPSDNDWWSITLCLEHATASGLSYIQVLLALNIGTVGYNNPNIPRAEDLSTNVNFRPSKDMFSVNNARPIFEIGCDPRTTTMQTVWNALHLHMPFYHVSMQSPTINHGWVRAVITGLARHLDQYALGDFDSEIQAQRFWPPITWPPYPGLIFRNPPNA